MPLSQAADRGIAGHLPDGVEVLGENPCVRSQTGGRQGGLDPSVSRPKHEDIKRLGILVHATHWRIVPRGTLGLIQNTGGGSGEEIRQLEGK